jgi:predicted ATP-grasp superfamily ATP-dependent carboligase
MTEGLEESGSILIPTGFDPGSYSCVRSLARRGVRTVVASEFESVPASASRFCDETIRIPAPKDDLLAYKDALLGIAARPDVRTIVPLRPHDPYLFSKFHEQFEQYVSLVTPSFETLKRVHDRLRLAEAAENAGVPVPETRLMDDVTDWGRELIIKSRYNLLTDEYVESLAPNESATVKSVTHLQPGNEPDREAIYTEMKHVPIVQEYVRYTNQYVFGALYDHGEPLATFQHRQIRGNSYTGGGGVYRESVSIPELESVGRRLLEELDWHGLACIEYMKDATTGEFVLTEINPRLWQSLPCAVRAGADFPYYYWQQAMGRSELIDHSYRVGVGSHLLYGELGYLLSVLHDDSTLVERPSFPATAWEILSSCYERPQFDTLRLDDPLPFVRGVRHVLRTKL